MAICFDIKLCSGRLLSSVQVQGNGGAIGASMCELRDCSDEEAQEHRAECVRHAMLRLDFVLRLANERRALPVYEPRPGCIKVTWVDDREEIVGIRGAKVLRAAWVK